MRKMCRKEIDARRLEQARTGSRGQAKECEFRVNSRNPDFLIEIANA